MIGQSRLDDTVDVVQLPIVQRTATDAPASIGAASGSPIYYPHASTLRRAWQWQYAPPELHGPDLARVAHHEAGHVVLLEWIGLTGATATATPSNGWCIMPPVPANCPDPGDDVTGELAATAASIFHAGAMAELLYLGIKWTGPLHYPKQVDFQRDDDMLLQRFGRLSSAGHGFAQRVALHVLAERWPRVREIADALVLRGVWE